MKSKTCHPTRSPLYLHHGSTPSGIESTKCHIKEKSGLGGSVAYISSISATHDLWTGHLLPLQSPPPDEYLPASEVNSTLYFSQRSPSYDQHAVQYYFAPENENSPSPTLLPSLSSVEREEIKGLGCQSDASCPVFHKFSNSIYNRFFLPLRSHPEGFSFLLPPGPTSQETLAPRSHLVRLG